jgi:ElaB/YqjD/DUF883 family membrane-anchored ribosome-binding protein
MTYESDPATDSPDEIRTQIEGTRTAITEKLEALESHVMDTVQSARDTVEETVQAARDTVQAAKDTVTDTLTSARDTVSETIETVKSSVAETVENVKQTFDIPAQVRRRPWAMVGGSFALGIFAGYLANRTYRAAAPALARTMQHHFTPPTPTASPVSLTPAAEPEPAGPSLFANLAETFSEEIEKAKGLALGYGLAAARDLLKQQIPQLGEQIDDVAQRLTTRLGAEPVPGPVFAPAETGQY